MMKLRRTLGTASLLGTFAIGAVASAQVPNWTNLSSPTGAAGRKVLIDGSQNVLALSTVVSAAGDQDIRVTKWSPAGTQLWRRDFNSGTGNDDVAYDMALDASNNVYVVGARQITTGVCFRLAAGTGAVNWTYTEGSVSSPFYGVAVNTGAVLIAMIRDSGGDQYALRSLNSATGASNWDDQRGFANGFSRPRLVTDGTANTIFVTDSDMTRYAANGTETWNVTLPGSIDPSAVRLDTSRDAIYIAGVSFTAPDQDWYVSRRRFSDGAMVWAKATNFFNGEDVATDMRLDGAGNPIVVGTVQVPPFGTTDAVVARYQEANGAIGWTNRYDGDLLQDDSAARLWVDGSSNTFLIGSSMTANRSDVLVRKVSGTGATLWSTVLDDGGVAQDDDGYSIAVDTAGHVYAMGAYTPSGGGSADRVTKLQQVTLTPNPASQTGGKPITWTAALNSAAVGAKTLALVSGSGSMTVPASVVIPNGATSATFTGTTTHVGSSTPVSVSAGGGKGNATLLPVVPLSVSTNVTSVFCGGALVGTVTLSGAAPAGGYVVALKDTSAAATTPAGILVEAGATTATFDIPTIPFGADANVTLRASLHGATVQSTFLVRRSVLASVTALPASAAAGTPRTGTVTLSGIAAASNVVTLTSSNPAVASVPASVAIVKNANAATFTINTFTVAANTNATISATMNAVTVTTTITVTPPAMSSVDFIADSVRSGNQASGVVRLTAPAPAGGLVVTLSSSAPAVASVPASVRVPAGARSVGFLLTAGAVGADTTVTITATRGVAKTTTIVVMP